MAIAISEPVVRRIKCGRDGVYTDANCMNTSEQIGELGIYIVIRLEAVHLWTLNHEHDVGVMAVVKKGFELVR